MKKYIVYYEGEGGRWSGCDYTIGCNLNVKFIEAEDIEEAYKDVLYQEFGSADENELMFTYSQYDAITIMEIGESKEVDINRLESETKVRIEKLKVAKKEAEEKVEYDRLKAKFDG